MPRILRTLLVLCLTVCLLWGCASREQTITVQELTITLPEEFTDLSAESYASGLALLYGDGITVIQASREEKDDLTPYFPEIDAALYAQLCLQSHSLPGTVEIIQDIPVFTYQSGDGDITYLCTVLASDAHFWLLQAYCPAEMFPEQQETLWKYLSTATIQ